MDFQSSLASTASIGLKLLASSCHQLRWLDSLSTSAGLCSTTLAPVAPLGPTLPTWLASFSGWNDVDSHVHSTSPHEVTCWSSQAPVSTTLSLPGPPSPFFSHLRSTCAPANPSPTRLLWRSPSHTTPQESPGFLLSPRVEGGTWVLV